MPLHLGKAENAGFADLADGDQIDLVWGVQGFLMVIRDLAVEADVEGAGDHVCFQCRLSISSPTGSFPETADEHMYLFSRLPDDLYSVQTILILTSTWDIYDGEAALLSASCDGHQRSGTVERTIDLSVPPPL